MSWITVLVAKHCDVIVLSLEHHHMTSSLGRRRVDCRGFAKSTWRAERPPRPPISEAVWNHVGCGKLSGGINTIDWEGKEDDFRFRVVHRQMHRGPCYCLCTLSLQHRISLECLLWSQQYRGYGCTRTSATESDQNICQLQIEGSNSLSF